MIEMKSKIGSEREVALSRVCVSVCVCVCVHAYPCHARRVWLIKVRYSRVMRDRTGSDRENGVFLLLPSDQ